MIRTALEPADVGLLHHHGPELLPMVDLIVGGGLPVAAAIVVGKWHSIRRLVSGGASAPDPPSVHDGRTPRSTPARRRASVPDQL